MAGRGPSAARHLSVSVVPLDARELPGVRSVKRRTSFPSYASRRPSVGQPSGQRPNQPPDQAVSARPFARALSESAAEGSRFLVSWPSLFFAARLLVAGAILSRFAIAAPPLDPTTPEVRMAIDRGVNYLRTHLDDVKIEECGIVGYAMIRGGEPFDSPAIRTLQRRVLEAKFDKSSYGKGTKHQFYEAGTDMMLLEAISPSRYVRELSLAASFTVDHQWPSGSWYYFGTTEHGGDTSHTQYAVLGLWAATRAGVRIPMSVWSRVADWHLKNQNEDGGFAYHPADGKASTHSMTVNGVASLCVARLMLYPDREYPSPFCGPGRRKRRASPAARFASGVRQC